MKSSSKISVGLYAYLDSVGVLTNGTDEQIQLARKEYIREYKRKWRNLKRKEQKEIRISCTEDELAILTAVAGKHWMNCTLFVKKAALAYSRKQYVVPRNDLLFEIKELLVLNYNSLQSLADDGIMPASLTFELLKQFAELETKILGHLFNPPAA